MYLESERHGDVGRGKGRSSVVVVLVMMQVLVGCDGSGRDGEKDQSWLAGKEPPRKCRH